MSDELLNHTNRTSGEDSAFHIPHSAIGIIGGSFDPIHIAHLIMAETVREALSLDFVLFLPTGTQPLKQGRRATSAHHRLTMVELAISGNPAFALSRVDVDRPGPSYTADSLARLRAELGPPDRADLWFIIGSDSLLTFSKWRDPGRILEQARLAVVRRPTFDLTNLEPILAGVPGLADSIDWIDAPLLQISGTDIRERAASGRSIRYRVTEAVRGYIESQGLYRQRPAK
jgi:nicotinate-nucleotide adenylyltransferase